MHDFLVVEMVLYPLDFLIVFMAFACNQDDIALLGEHTCRADGLTAVNDADDLFHLLRGEACQHVVDDVLRFFKPWVVAGDDHFVALFHSLLCHDGAFALVAVTAGTTYGDDLALAVEHLVDGLEHVLQCIGGVA